MRRRNVGLGIALLTAWSVAGTATPTQAALPKSLPVFNVVQQGLNVDQATELSRAFGVDASFADGSVRYVSPSFDSVPMKAKTVTGRDEDGRKTVGSFFNLPAIQKIKPLSNAAALRLVADAFNQANTPLPEGAKPTVGRTMLHIQPKVGRGDGFAVQIATSVRYRLSLAGYPLVGPGADIGVTLDPTGKVTDLRESASLVEQGPTVQLVSEGSALAQCRSKYPRDARISMSIVYQAPDLSLGASQLMPWYECSGRAPGGAELVSALVPAVRNATPTVRIQASSGSGGSVSARVTIVGGHRPYHVQWVSTNGALPAVGTTRRSLRYVVPGTGARSDHLMVVVTDANGVTGQASADVTVSSTAAKPNVASHLSVVPNALGRLDVGEEVNVSAWSCTRGSFAGFYSEFSSHGVPVAFRFMAPNAWEQDFRDTATRGGDDNSYVDNVDLAWYTGHGNPGGFTFDNSAHTDGSIVPNDARWGDRDLEWLQLESCNVLQFTDGSGTPIWSRWSQTFDGLHMLNGFQTTAQCIDVPGGTAGRFSDWLLGRNFYGLITLPPLMVRQAWAMMALDLEPSGKQYVSMGVFGAGGVTDFNDYFWGLGPVGPDIPKSQITGYWWLVGQV